MTIKLPEVEVVEGYLSGRSLRDLAEEYGVSVQPICRVLRNNGIEGHTGRVRGADRRPRAPRNGARGVDSFSDEEVADAVALYRGGLLIRQVAERLGCSPGTASKVLRRGGLPAGRNGVRGERNTSWQGGRSVKADGTVSIRVDPDDPIAVAMSNGHRRYLPEYRLVMAHHLGRPLAATEQVHHKNGDHSDNRIENLQLRSGPHGKGASFRCRVCGSQDVEAVAIADG